MIRQTDFGVCVTEYFAKHLAGVRNLSGNTIKSYRDTFCLLLQFLCEEMRLKPEKVKLSSITDETIKNFLEWLEVNRSNSASTRNLRLAAIHAFYRYVLMQHPEMLLPAQRILAIPLKKKERTTVNYLSENVLRDLLARPDQSDKYGVRDTALLCLLYDSGARVQEIIDLSLSDIRLETLATVRLFGKGRKVRIVPLMTPTAKVLQKYLAAWNLDIKTKPDAPLFVNHQGNRLTRPGVTYILKKYMSEIGADETLITPHVIRHSKAMHLLRADVDLNYIRDFLGHVNTSTTEVYAKADAEMKRKALEKANFDVPLEKQTTWQKNESLMAWLQSL
jgi:site-specific recombinase XerD